MRSRLISSTLFPSVFWSIFFLFLFATPMLMAARDGGDETDAQDTEDEHTSELIRQHREVMSPFYSVPEAHHSLGGKQLRNGPAMTNGKTEEWSFVHEAKPEIEPMIRPVENRAKRIRV